MRNTLNLHKKVAEKFNISEDTVKRIEYHIFDYIRIHMQKGETDPILIHNFGTISPNLSQTQKEIRRVIARYRKGKIDREEAVKKVTRLWKIRNAAISQMRNDGE